MITVKNNLHYGRRSVEVTFKVDVARDIFEASYDDSLLRDAIEARMMRQLHKELDEMYFKHAFEGRIKED